MKLMHHSVRGAGEQDGMRARPKHNDASRPKRNPFRFLTPAVASLAALAGLSLGSMVAPKQAMARNSDAALMTQDTAKSAKLQVFNYVYSHFNFGFGPSCIPFKEVGNVPLELRTVPVYPDDITAYGQSSSWSQPIGSTLQFDASNTVMEDPYFSIGLGASFINRSIMLEAGVGGKFMGVSDQPFINERDYLENYAPTTGDSTSYVRGYGTALTYYCVNLSDYIMPYAYAELSVALSDHVRLAGGFNVDRESFTAQKGWDRYDMLTAQQSYGFTTLVTGMPYLTLYILPLMDSTLGVTYGISVRGGVKYPVKNMPSAMMKSADFVFQPAWSLGFGIDLYIFPASKYE